MDPTRTTRRTRWPLVEIKVFEEEFSEQERRGVIEAITDVMARFTGESIRPDTWVVLQEVRNGSWGIGGAPLSLPDVRALQRPTVRVTRQATPRTRGGR